MTRLIALGTAARYNVPIFAEGEWQTLSQGAFTDSLRWDPVEARLNHLTSVVLGHRADGTLQLRETPTGLRFAIDLETRASHKWGVLEQLRAAPVAVSVRFRVTPEHTREIGSSHSAIDRATLIEVSLLTAWRRPVDRGAGASLELVCESCWTRGVWGRCRRGRCEVCGASLSPRRSD